MADLRRGLTGFLFFLAIFREVPPETEYNWSLRLWVSSMPVLGVVITTVLGVVLTICWCYGDNTFLIDFILSRSDGPLSD